MHRQLATADSYLAQAQIDHEVCNGRRMHLYLYRRWQRQIPGSNRKSSTGSGRGEESRHYSVSEGKGTGRFGFSAQDGTGDQIVPFRKSDSNFVELPEEKKQEEIQNIRNGIGFAKKVLTTGECDLLILDEVLGLVEKDIITVDTLKALLECRGDTDVILTGITLNDEICVLADEVSKIETVKFKVWD